MKNFIVAAFVCFAALSCNSSENTDVTDKDSTQHHTETSQTGTAAPTDNHMKAMHDAMDNNMSQMHNLPLSGNTDQDFAMLMMHHHKGAIEMAQIELRGGTDESMKQIAQKMIDEQSRENEQFNRYVQIKSQGEASDYGKRTMGMMTPMSNIKMNGSSLDAMFASMMIPHHQDAIKMAEEYLQVGKNEDLKKIAKDITRNQPKDIQELQSWLQKK